MLQILHLENNAGITELVDDSFADLQNLENLSLGSCSIERVATASFNGLWKLVSLDLSQNRIGGNNLSPEVFDSLPDLISLDISGNRMTTIASEYSLFTNLDALEELYMSNIQCTNFSKKIFQPLAKLKG